MRVFLTALVLSLLAGAVPASAQGSCDQWCRSHRCSGGGLGNAPGAPPIVQAEPNGLDFTNPLPVNPDIQFQSK